MLDFYVELFGDRFSATFSVLTAEKHAWKICGKIRRENSVQKIVFRFLFSLCFSLFSSHPILRATFCLKTEKIRTESALRQISLNDMVRSFPLMVTSFVLMVWSFCLWVGYFVLLAIHPPPPPRGNRLGLL